MESNLYINEIGEKLGRKRAVLMVGAGFSKNADPMHGISLDTKFPDWNELGDEMVRQLNPNPKPNSLKYQNLLKLAEEYEAAFKRVGLDQFIRDSIPDNQFEPSELYEKLLELPWKDIFTTNYDTLLERASKKLISRNYSIVNSQDALVYARDPRIVKLHGSLPDQQPFILTEEDYRTYEKKYPIFINTFKQSIIENILVLIGFSGDDPNFLNWIGWLRDILGNGNANKIFLIEPGNLTISKLKLLQSKNIEVIQLGDLYSNLSIKTKLNHFLNDLLRISKKKNWDWEKLKLLRSLHSLKINFNENKNLQVEKNLSGLKKYIKLINEIREDFPGWLVLPVDKHYGVDEFVHKIKSYLEYSFVNKFLESEPELVIDLLFNYLWIIDISGKPITPGLFGNHVVRKLIKYFEKNQVYEVQKCIEIYRISIKYCRQNLVHNLWKRLISINNNFLKKHQNKIDAIQEIEKLRNSHLNPLVERDFNPLSSSHEDRLLKNETYDVSLESGWSKSKKLEIQSSLHKIRNIINSSEEENITIYAIEAKLLFLLNFIEGAEKYFNQDYQAETNEVYYNKYESEILFNLQRKLENQEPKINNFYIPLNQSVLDISEKFPETIEDFKKNKVIEYPHILDELIREHKKKNKEEYLAKYRERLVQLVKYKIDYHLSFQFYSEQLKPIEVNWKNNRDIYFYIYPLSEYDKSFQMPSWNEYILAYEFLDFHEKIGFPYSVENVNFNLNRLKDAVYVISYFNIKRAIYEAIRINDEKLMDAICSRKSFLRISCPNIFFNQLYVYLKYLLSLREKNNSRKISIYEKRIKTLLVCLGKVTVITHFELSKKLIPCLKEIYENVEYYSDLSLNVSEVFRTMFSTFSSKQILEIIPELLSFPYVEIGGNQFRTWNFLDPIILINLDRLDQNNKSTEVTINFDELKKNIISTEIHIRKIASYRLFFLWYIQVIPTKELLELREAFLSIKRKDSLFPDNTDLLDFAVLEFYKHEPKMELEFKNRLITSFKQKILELQSMTDINPMDYDWLLKQDSSSEFNNIMGSKEFLDWEASELKIILELVVTEFVLILEKYSSNKRKLDKWKYNEFVRNINIFCILIGLFFPRFSAFFRPENMENDLLRIKLKLKELNFVSFRLEAILCLLGNVDFSIFKNQFEENLAYGDLNPMITMDLVYSTFIFSKFSSSSETENLSSQVGNDRTMALLNVLNKSIEFRKLKNLPEIFNLYRDILKLNNPGVINKEFLKEVIRVSEFIPKLELVNDISHEKLMLYLNVQKSYYEFLGKANEVFDEDFLKTEREQILNSHNIKFMDILIPLV